MCLGFSTNFSKKTVSSPKAVLASLRASLKARFNCSASRTTRMPRPPPPDAAFNITGKPMRIASLCAMPNDVRDACESGIIGTPAAFATIFAAILSPSCSMDSGSGPTKTMPSSRQRFAKCTFSLKNPYPG